MVSVVTLSIAVINTPVTPNGDFTATFGDFKFGLVAGDRCVVAFSRRLAVTPKHRSQQIASFLHN